MNDKILYLISSEWVDLKGVIKCTLIKKIKYSKRNDFWLMSLDPVITYTDIKFGTISIDKAILATRHVNHSLDKITEWPEYVYIIRLLNNEIEYKNEVQKEDIQNIAWGEVYNNKEAALRAIK
ncbi:MAG: hypothetical protein JXA53_09340 [Bacteroidales bacterium]|nr:hypothetical protein [Bacteroidales bacterium]